MTTTTLEPMDDRTAAYRAVNQLLSVVVGSRFARETDHLKDTPLKRVSECLGLTLEEYKDAASKADPKVMKQAQRKLDSLGSLALLATLAEEVVWEEEEE